MILFIKLLLSHILGDFVLQPDKWIKDKEKNKIRSRFLYYHLLVHTAVIFLVLRFNKTYLWACIIIIVSHLAIDLTKVYILNVKNKKLLFFADQLAHIAVIGIIAYMYEPFPFEPDLWFNPQNILLLTTVLFVTFVSSVIIKILISQWSSQISSETKLLVNAGLYIGMLERLFVFTFIILNHWEGIGFLLAAKSVFRFGDLSNANDRKLTEYVLIGTLISFAFAIGTSFAYEYFVSVIANLK